MASVRLRSGQAALALAYAIWDGPLAIAVYDANGNRVALQLKTREPASIRGRPGEFVSYSLAGLTEGTYYVRIAGAEATIDNGDGTSTGTGVYGTASPYYLFELDLNDDIPNRYD